ncbi:efflux RND transporter periplasmic adaptor subunit [Stieleria mannarensis]|uniref:efflux RND transporter periplasmic adaptor subunit n=1 Tax=Stieleria mannarensis TaxID=2755585 RepID=UPI001C7217D9|nr:HlyD family efflux transporter periplasmic adaptor subunit [Rhodopirellula sp. JC639]
MSSTHPSLTTPQRRSADSGTASAIPGGEAARGEIGGSTAESSTVADSAKSLALIQCVAEAKDQTAAIIAMVNFIAKQFPTSRVRCGLGASQMRRFYECRLGWLGPASELFQNAAEGWNDDASSLPTRPDVPAMETTQNSVAPSDLLRLNLDDDVGLGRCVLWIDGGELTPADRTWLRRALPSLRAIVWMRGGGVMTQFWRWLSHSGMTGRIYIGLAAVVVVLLVIWPVSYRVRCTTVVRPKYSRIVSAPFDATLQAAHVQPGDSVKQGDVLISLDGRPLRLELEAIEAQIGQVLKERDVAMVGGRVAESQQANLKIRELNRQRDLLISRLDRLNVTSPIDGIIVLGDLHRSIGAPLETGQAVLEIAPLGEMVVELEIPEYEIGYVTEGMPARVRLTATEGDAIERPIDAVYPSAELRDDQNVFVAHIHVDNQDGTLRPGMRGDAIAYGRLRPWLWSMIRSGWEKTLWWIGY